MTALEIIGMILLLFLLLSLLRVGVIVDFGGELRVRLRVGPVKLTVLPRKEKKAQKKAAEAAGPVARGDPLPVCLRPAHQLAAGGCLAAVHKERLVHLLEAPPYELHTPVHAVHAVGLAVLLPVAALLDRADLTDRHGEDVTCLRHWLCCSSRC